MMTMKQDYGKQGKRSVEYTTAKQYFAKACLAWLSLYGCQTGSNHRGSRGSGNSHYLGEGSLCWCAVTMEVNGDLQLFCFILQNIFFFVQQKNLIHTDLEQPDNE